MTTTLSLVEDFCFETNKLSYALSFTFCNFTFVNVINRHSTQVVRYTYSIQCWCKWIIVTLFEHRNMRRPRRGSPSYGARRRSRSYSRSYSRSPRKLYPLVHCISVIWYILQATCSASEVLLLHDYIVIVTLHKFYPLPSLHHNLTILPLNCIFDANFELFLPHELCSARYMPWPCVYVSVTSWSFTKMAKHRNT